MFLRPTTPTSAGLAQVFDTSGLVQYAYQERQRRQERLQKNTLEYDPSKMWDKHIPEYQERYKELEEFVSTNHQALLNATDNMDIWREYKSKQNDIKNFVAVAAQDMTNSYEGLHMLANEKYSNSANEELIDAKFNKPVSRDFYKDPNWALDPRNAMRRNVDINYRQIADFVTKNIAEKITEIDPERTKRAKAAGVDLFAEQTNLYYNRDSVKAALKQEFVDDPDIQYKYGSDEAGLDAFTDDILTMVRKEDRDTAMQISRRGATKPSAGFWSMQVMPGSSADKPIVDQGFRQQVEGGAEIKTTENLYLHSEPGSILLFPNVKLRTQFRDAYSLRDAGKVADPEKYRDGIMLKYTMSRRVKPGQFVELTTADGKPIVFHEGQYLPDYEDDSQWDVSESRLTEIRGRSYQQESAVMYAGTDAAALLSKIEEEDIGAENIFQFLEDERPSGDFIITPYAEVSSVLNAEMIRRSQGQYNLEQVMNAHRSEMGKVNLFQGVEPK